MVGRLIRLARTVRVPSVRLEDRVARTYIKWVVMASFMVRTKIRSKCRWWRVGECWAPAGAACIGELIATV